MLDTTEMVYNEIDFHNNTQIINSINSAAESPHTKQAKQMNYYFNACNTDGFRLKPQYFFQFSSIGVSLSSTWANIWIIFVWLSLENKCSRVIRKSCCVPLRNSIITSLINWIWYESGAHFHITIVSSLKYPQIEPKRIDDIQHRQPAGLRRTYSISSALNSTSIGEMPSKAQRRDRLWRSEETGKK